MNALKTPCGSLRGNPLCIVLHGYAQFAASVVQIMSNKQSLMYKKAARGKAARRLKSPVFDKLNQMLTCLLNTHLYIQPLALARETQVAYLSLHQLARV